MAAGAGAGAWPCPAGPQAGPACSADSGLPTRWVFLLLEEAVWDRGDWSMSRGEGAAVGGRLADLTKTAACLHRPHLQSLSSTGR